MSLGLSFMRGKMVFRNIVVALLALPLFFGCQAEKGAREVEGRERFGGILEIQQSPKVATEHPEGLFSDQGSWMGFAHQDEGRVGLGFSGPFSLRSYEWSAPALVEVLLANGEQFSNVSRTYLPGMMVVEGELGEGKRVRLELIFADSDVALLRISTPEVVDLLLQGVFFENTEVETFPLSLRISGSDDFSLHFPSEVEIKTEGNGYKVAISVTDELTLAIVHEREERGATDLRQFIEESAQHFSANEERWNSYLASVLRPSMPEGFDWVAAKSIVTLISNWRAPEGDLPYAGIIPSHAKDYFIGFWAWDTWKTAVAMVDFTPELAKEQILSMLHFQDSLGIVADCVYADSSENNWRNTKPPLTTWAVDVVYRATGDREFLKKVFPRLLKYHRWWYEYRDVDGNGFCEYGATDGTRVAAAWESGMDNAVRFDEAKMLPGQGDQSSLDQESVDLNAFLLQERRLLQSLALELGKPFEIEGVSEKEFGEYFYDSESHYFFDRKIGGQELIQVQGSEAFVPIWTELATENQVAEMLPTLTDTHKFSTFVPFPTLAADHPKFSYDGYWRGPIWVDQSYFAISGLRKYGYSDLANRYTEQLFHNLAGATERAPLCENYDPHTGETLQARHFSWTAAHLLMLYKEYEVVRDKEKE